MIARTLSVWKKLATARKKNVNVMVMVKEKEREKEKFCRRSDEIS